MNPVNLELAKINRRWRKEISNYPNVKMYTCLGEKHEVQLFDGLMKSKMEDDTGDDCIYLLHYQDFVDKDTFGKSLFEDWSEYYSMWQKTKSTVPIWKMDSENNGKGHQSDAFIALNALLDLKNKFKELKEIIIYIYVAPTKISDFKDFEIWVNDWCRLCDQQSVDDIKLIWSEHHTHRILSQNKWTHSFRVEVDIHQLMQNTAAHTNSKKNSPDTDFQQQILIASNHLSKKRFSEAKLSLQNAIKLARNIKNKEGEITCYFMLTQVHNAKSEHSEVQEIFDTIFRKVENNSILEVQMYMNYGGYLLGRSKKAKAEDVFNNAAKISENIGNYAMAMECYRIIGAFNDTLVTKSKMLYYYEKAVEISNQISPELIEQSSLRAIASLLIKKYDAGSELSKKLDIRMKTYFGEDWQVLVEQPKNF